MQNFIIGFSQIISIKMLLTLLAGVCIYCFFPFLNIFVPAIIMAGIFIL